MPECFIFGAGPFFGLSTVPQNGDLILAADGGLLHCETLGLTPDLIIGDFDSLGHIPLGENTCTYPPEKDDTDTMLAIKAGLNRGHTRFHLYGCTGGRMDHTLASLQSIAYLASHGARGFLYDEKAWVYTVLHNDSLTLPSHSEGIFSLFCLGPEAKGVSISGGQYALENGSLSPCFPLGVSNHFIGNPVTVSVADGFLILCWESDCPP